MLRILKANPLLSLVVPILIVILIWCCSAIIYAVPYLKSDMPMFEVALGWLFKVRIVAVFVALGLLLLQAYIWNTFINKQTLLRQSSYFPAMFYLLLLSCRHDLINFYPSLVAALFLMLSLKRLSDSYKKEKALSEAFDAGVYIGIASIIYFPVTIFIVYLWIGLLTMRSIVWREWLISLIGFVLPFAFVLAYYSIFYSPEHFWYDRLLVAVTNYRKISIHGWQHILLLVAFGLTALFSTFFFFQKISDNIVKNQKISAMMVWFILFSLASIALSPKKDAYSFSLLAIPFSFIFANYFGRTKSKFIPEVLFTLLIASIIINVFF